MSPPYFDVTFNSQSAFATTTRRHKEHTRTQWTHLLEWQSTIKDTLTVIFHQKYWADPTKIQFFSTIHLLTSETRSPPSKILERENKENNKIKEESTSVWIFVEYIRSAWSNKKTVWLKQRWKPVPLLPHPRRLPFVQPLCNQIWTKTNR